MAHSYPIIPLSYILPQHPSDRTASAPKPLRWARVSQAPCMLFTLDEERRLPGV